jgi:hypothetical protein
MAATQRLCLPIFLGLDPAWQADIDADAKSPNPVPPIMPAVGAASYRLAFGEYGRCNGVIEAVEAQNGHLRTVVVKPVKELRIEMFHVIVLCDELVADL